MRFLPHIQLAEAVEPEGHKLGADLGFRQFLTGDLCFQFFFRGLQFFQTPLRGLGEDALLNSVEQILDAQICLPKLSLVQRKVDILLLL